MILGGIVQRLPQVLQSLVDQLALFPGVGPKSALRMGLTLLQWPEEKVRALGKAILELRDSLCICSQCGNLADEDPCHICSDPTRRDDILCVLADWDSLLNIEDSGFFKGKYLVLGALLPPFQDSYNGTLDIDRLRDRLKTDQVQEIILALGATRDAEATESYIKNLVQQEYTNIRITRLAQGIPVGSDLKFIDRETLRQSLTYRQDLA